jgi:protein-disulfide isomerase
MKPLSLVLAAITAFASPVAAAPAKTAAVVSGETANGFRFGSVSARTKLVEYASLNCPHCGAFAKEANPAIIQAVKSGRMLYEFRPVALFPQDIAAHALAKCVPAGARLSFIDDYYRNQRGVYGRFQAATADDKANASLNAALAAGETQAARKLALVGGMIPIAARHGLAPAAADRCLGNPVVLKWVGSVTQAANAAGVTSTPTFELNGKRIEVAALLEQLKR